MNERHHKADLLSQLFVELEIVVLERTEDGQYQFAGTPAAWFSEFCPRADGQSGFEIEGVSLFLDNFLIDAEQFWRDEKHGSLRSGAWTEQGHGGREWTLEATAIRAGGEDVLLLSAPYFDHDAIMRLLQTSREQSRDYQQLLKEIEKRQVLLHCIIHDLNNPLVGIKGGLQLLEARKLVPQEGHKLLEIALRQTDKMQWLIRSIMDVFSDDTRPLVPAALAFEMAPDVHAVASDVAAKLSIQGAMKSVSVEVREVDEGVDHRVVGDERRLERVLYNLAENALRFSPAESAIVLEVEVDGDEIVASVNDRGPGVPPEMRSRLFQRFASGPDKPGQAGLGLHFCKITVEDWGGSIGYSPRDGGGARFWIRLPRPRSIDDRAGVEPRA